MAPDEWSAQDWAVLHDALLPPGIEDPAPGDFNRLAQEAAALGRPVIPALMLLARDGHKPLGQLCAIKAIGMMDRTPVRLAALERIYALELPGIAGWIVKYARADFETRPRTAARSISLCIALLLGLRRGSAATMRM
jgi:hypothetical protein